MRWGSRSGSVTFHDRLQRGRERSQPQERFGAISGMPETAENLAREYGISREESDDFAARSHRRAEAAWTEGRFRDEVVPVTLVQKKGPPLLFERDEGIRPDTTVEVLAKLRPVIPGGTVTSGEAGQQNDAAAGWLGVCEDLLEGFRLEPAASRAALAASGG